MNYPARLGLSRVCLFVQTIVSTEKKEGRKTTLKYKYSQGEFIKSISLYLVVDCFELPNPVGSVEYRSMVETVVIRTVGFGMN